MSGHDRAKSDPAPVGGEPPAPWARIIIVAYCSARHIQGAIDALARQSDGDFEAVIVDNQCPEDTLGAARLPDGRFAGVRAGANLGFAGGSNFGAAGARTPWIITLNPDARPERTWLAALKAAARGEPRYAMLSSTLVSDADPHCVDGFGDVLSIFGLAWRGAHGAPVETLPHADVEVFGPCGAAAAIRRTEFERIGGFDPHYFCYLEDVDLAFRLRRAGERCLQVRDAVVRHVGGGSSSGDGLFEAYQTYRNNLRLIIKNAPLALLPAMLAAYASSQSYILWRNRRAPANRARLKGLRAAIGELPRSFAARKDAARHAVAGAAPIARRLAWRRRELSGLRPVFWQPDEPGPL